MSLMSRDTFSKGTFSENSKLLLFVQANSYFKLFFQTYVLFLSYFLLFFFLSFSLLFYLILFFCLSYILALKKRHVNLLGSRYNSGPLQYLHFYIKGLQDYT